MASLVQDALDYAAEQTQQALAALGSTTKKETTVWMDGAFDGLHFGHANAFRQGRTLGTRLRPRHATVQTARRGNGDGYEGWLRRHFASPPRRRSRTSPPKVGI